MSSVVWVLVDDSTDLPDTVTSLGDGLDAPDGSVWAASAETLLPSGVEWTGPVSRDEYILATNNIPALLDALIPAEMLVPQTAAQKLESLGVTTDELRELLE